MATLREVRARIAGIKKTQKITRAMKMVAAAKLRRAQTNVMAARPYAAALRRLLDHLASAVDLSAHPFMAQRETRSVALLVVTADRGLCGAFNSNLLKAAVNHINTQYSRMNAEGKVRIYCVGRKGSDYFSRRSYAVAGKYIGVFHNLTFGEARAVVRDITDAYRSGEVDRVEVVYNEFKSIARQRIVVDRFLPLGPSGDEDTPQKSPGPTNYIFEPSDSHIAETLIPRHMDFQLWRILLESNAAEQGARMAAMDNATENADELISSLQLVYNKARQASITKELLEIVAGAEALKKTG